MENSILNKISAIIITEEKTSENMISLLQYIELINNINDEINSKFKEIIKKMNNKLSNNLNFFNYEIKEIKINDKITLIVNHELKVKTFDFNKKTLKVIEDFKNSNIFIELIIEDLKKILDIYNDYNYLENISIKSKYKEISISINSNSIEVFMHKSPNWITMGKAFSLKYDLTLRKFYYALDPIGLENNIKNQEKLLFSKVFIEKTLLSNELLIKNEYFLNRTLETKKENLFKKWLSKIINIMKK